MYSTSQQRVSSGMSGFGSRHSSEHIMFRYNNIQFSSHSAVKLVGWPRASLNILENGWEPLHKFKAHAVGSRPQTKGREKLPLTSSIFQSCAEGIMRDNSNNQI